MVMAKNSTILSYYIFIAKTIEAKQRKIFTSSILGLEQFSIVSWDDATNQESRQCRFILTNADDFRFRALLVVRRSSSDS